MVGFFATAGAAGADIAMNSRNDEDVHIGGITGILLPTVLAGEVVHVHRRRRLRRRHGPDGHLGNYNPRRTWMSDDPVKLMPDILGQELRQHCHDRAGDFGLPGGVLLVLHRRQQLQDHDAQGQSVHLRGHRRAGGRGAGRQRLGRQGRRVFAVIGASFGPVCGAMLADYLMSGRKWSGPRAGFNPAGWISWIVGFAVGAFNLVVDLLLKWDPVHYVFVPRWDWVAAKFPHLADLMDPATKVCNYVPLPPVTAFVVGFALYVLLSVLGARTKKLPMPGVTA